MAEFPTISGGRDQEKYNEEIEDPSMKTEAEGGYEITRPRFTRPPRTTYSDGYTNLSNDDKRALESFYKEVHGGSDAWEWTSPIDGQRHLVRFIEKLQFKYARGIKRSDDPNDVDHRWNVEFKVKEV